ncbi:MAG: outer membrane lipoprotein-sorting protein [Desulfobacterales bacterium]
MNRKHILLFCGLVCLLSVLPTAGHAQDSTGDADRIVRESFNYFRGKASESIVEMTIQRPEWKREMTLQGWTRGESDSLFFITAPARDEGNGTLKKGREMWTYNPKVSRVIKLPPSMMSQSWMGSDFSNNDLARSDSLLYDYVHTLEGKEMHEGKTVWVIKSLPKPDAPVLWGMQRLKIREDQIMISQEFFDEDMKSVKILTAWQMEMMGGRLFPRFTKMRKTETEDAYTLLEYRKLEFLDHLPDDLFTLSALRRPRR